jgi:hypothetical protein
MSGHLLNSVGDMLLALVGCGIVIGIGAYLIAWCKQLVYEEGAGSNDMMSTFHELHEQGELSDEEYKSIKCRLAGKLQHEAKKAG